MSSRAQRSWVLQSRLRYLKRKKSRLRRHALKQGSSSPLPPMWVTHSHTSVNAPRWWGTHIWQDFEIRRLYFIQSSDFFCIHTSIDIGNCIRNIICNQAQNDMLTRVLHNGLPHPKHNRLTMPLLHCTSVYRLSAPNSLTHATKPASYSFSQDKSPARHVLVTVT